MQVCAIGGLISKSNKKISMRIYIFLFLLLLFGCENDAISKKKVFDFYQNIIGTNLNELIIQDEILLYDSTDFEYKRPGLIYLLNNSSILKKELEKIKNQNFSFPVEKFSDFKKNDFFFSLINENDSIVFKNDIFSDSLFMKPSKNFKGLRIIFNGPFFEERDLCILGVFAINKTSGYNASQYFRFRYENKRWIGTSIFSDSISFNSFMKDVEYENRYFHYTNRLCWGDL